MQQINSGEDAGAFFDVCREQLDRMVAASKHEALTVLPMIKAGKHREAHAYARGER